jgi:3-deoxy-manno-octulosonate cytidylyltransferase (CMP-KDO synthetase)
VDTDMQAPFWHHIGVYAYRREALEKFVNLPVSKREKERSLEQMRALDNEMKIAVVRVDEVPLGVDTPHDLEIARRMLKDQK